MATFENLSIRDLRSGRKGEKRIFSLEMEDDPDYEKEREHIEAVIERYCKELVPVMKNRFEIAETLVRAKVVDKAEEKKKKLARYRVTQDVMALAKPDTVFMHCMPAHRGEEVSAEVIDGRQSIVYDQAENRLHINKAALTLLLDRRK